MKDIMTLEVQALLNGYSTRYGFDPENHIDQRNMKTLDEARDLYEGGQKFSLLFGPHSEPSCHVEIFQTGSNGGRRIDVDFFEGDEISRIYNLKSRDARFEHTKDEMLLVQCSSNWGRGGRRRGGLLIADAVIANGDLPTLNLPGEECFAVSVPWQDFYMGPIPSFDALASGDFIEGLPVITMPPDALLKEFREQNERKPSDPKRAPAGRFLGGDWVVGSA